VFAKLRTWLDHRTGYKKLLEVLLLEHIPGGAKWRYVWGSCLAFVFSLQVITGLLLMTAYSPGDSTAWGSVYFIQYHMEFGWLIRGLHHFGSQAMVVLLGLHMLQVVIAGAHLPPREVNWWLGLALMGAILGLSLTGYLLPWDQKGYWATGVATNIAGNLPGAGSFIKRILVGGPEYGNHTLTRFYALHVGVLPATVVVLLVLHITAFRRHGVTAPKDAVGKGMFWPDQAFKDLLACLVVFGILLYMVIFGGHGHEQHAVGTHSRDPVGARAPDRPPADERSLYETIALAGKDGRGANLDAPADPQVQYPARPEWYFLFLFQLLKYFQGDLILVGTVIIPNGAGVLLFLLPLFGYGKMRPLGHVLGVLVVVGILAAAASLTCLALADDNPDPLARTLLQQIAFLVIPVIAGVLLVQLGILAILPRGGFRQAVMAAGVVLLAVLGLGAASGVYGSFRPDLLPEHVRTELAGQVTETQSQPSEATKKAKGFRHQVEQSEENGERAVELAQRGIPPEGAALLLQRDPLTAGKKLFDQHCAVCHAHKALPGKGGKASDLTTFGTRDWLVGLLDHAGDPQYFGNVKIKDKKGKDVPAFTRMASWGMTHHELRQSYKDIIAANTGKGDADSKKALADAQKDLAEYDDWLDRVVTWLTRHPTGPKRENPANPEEIRFAQGFDAFFNKKIDEYAGKELHCASCHSYNGEGGKRGPDLTGYGSAEWLRLMIVAPAHPERYNGKNLMTAFRNDQGPGAELLLNELVARQAGDKYTVLSDVDRELIIRFLLKDDRLVFFGRPITSP
jgi:quinol-cytochrome oxidoreductase complex cytochrome b subunit/mono/diheme cytochrome c family protein